MPSTTAELIDLLDLKQVDEMSFVGAQPRTRMQRIYGGQVLAQAIAAAYQSIPSERQIHSLHAYFLRPGNAHGNMRFNTFALRDGKTFSIRRIEAFQQDREIFVGEASFHALETGLDHADPMTDQIPAPDECPRLTQVMEERMGPHPFWHEWDALDVRFIGDSSPGGSLHPDYNVAKLRVWIRTEGSLPDDPRVHHSVLAYLSDLTLLSASTVPHPVEFMSTQIQAASIDHAVWFHRPFRADEWLLYDMYSPSASYALGFCNGRLFQKGALVASCAQEGLIRRVKGRELLT